MITNVSQCIFFFSLAGLFVVLVGYPLLVWILAVLTPPPRVQNIMNSCQVSLIIVVHNCANLIIPKLQNSQDLDFPKEKLEIIFFSDGSDDTTGELLASQKHDNLQTLIAEEHKGKFSGLNRAVQAATGEILVFSDIDAILEPQALKKLLRHFEDSSVGGVCGQRMVDELWKPLSGAQSFYVRLDSYLKGLESRLGSITSNDGKLYAIRKWLFKPVPPGVTDDLFTALTVIARHKRFIYEAEAVARVKLPSRNTRHEVTRRRRIVSRSLNSIFQHRPILDPRKYGLFSLRLLINKVLRRALPLFLLAILPTSWALYGSAWLYNCVLGLQLLFYLAAAAFLLFPPDKRNSTPVKICATAYYISIGMAGTLLGIIDCIHKPPPAKWKPVKNDSKETIPP